MIHEGEACIFFVILTLITESGHYYNFIYDKDHNMWRKYSDINVEVVDEVTVLTKSYGIFTRYKLLIVKVVIQQIPVHTHFSI